MKKSLALVTIATVLLFAGHAEGAVTFDPGTRLTVACKKVPRGFEADTEIRHRARANRRTWLLTFGHFEMREPPKWAQPPTSANVMVADAWVIIRSAGKRRYRIVTSGSIPVTWRGC